MSYYIFNVPFMGNRKNDVVKADAHGQIYLEKGSVPVTLSAGDVNTMTLNRMIEELVYEDGLPEMTDAQYSKWYDSSVLVDGVRMGRKPKGYNPNYGTMPNEPKVASEINMRDVLPITATGIDARASEWIREFGDAKKMSPSDFATKYIRTAKDFQSINETSDAE